MTLDIEKLKREVKAAMRPDAAVGARQALYRSLMRDGALVDLLDRVEKSEARTLGLAANIEPLLKVERDAILERRHYREFCQYVSARLAQLGATKERVSTLSGAFDLIEEEHRAALTRALTAQAWAVACCWLEDVGREHIICPDYSCFPHLERTAALLAPAEVAAEILGGGT